MRGIEDWFDGIEQVKSFATFSALLENRIKTEKRYGRPCSVCALQFMFLDPVEKETTEGTQTGQQGSKVAAMVRFTLGAAHNSISGKQKTPRSDEAGKHANSASEDAPEVPLGDATRETVVTLLRETLRDSDFLFVAGDLVVIALPETSPEQLGRIEERVVKGLNQSMIRKISCRYQDWSGMETEDILRRIQDAL
ncbi:hypothetical protein THS27_25715 [Thalassospira sp. MCCC 1A01428]|nr:hypothetical protein THS27_25715 [Thalassospira sp. MCCC 1A01428]